MIYHINFRFSNTVPNDIETKIKEIPDIIATRVID